MKKIPKPSSFFTSNFHMHIDPEFYIGRGICADLCIMTAITAVNEKSQINLNRCIGYGNGIIVCPEKTIQLKK